MKKRAFNLLNFFALNVLFFALYLNFIHKDTNELAMVSATSKAAAQKLTSTARTQVASNIKPAQKTTFEN